MKRLATAKGRCRRCPFCAPSGRCLDPTRRSGRCGDWVWYFRGAKQCRRRYTCPKDPRTPAQLLRRARLKAASRKYSHSLTEEQRTACITAAAKVRSRPRLGQSGPLTGQQYWVHEETAQVNAGVKGKKAQTAPQVAQPQRVTRSTSERYRGSAVGPPGQHRMGTVRARKGEGGRKNVESRRKKQPVSSEVLQSQRLTASTRRHYRSMARARPWRATDHSGGSLTVARPDHVWYTPCVTRNTITIRLRRPKAEIEAKAKPNLNAWVNQLIEQALGPRSADWNEHFDRPSPRRRFHSSSKVKRAER